jgi:hypothetical protein
VAEADCHQRTQDRSWTSISVQGASSDPQFCGHVTPEYIAQQLNLPVGRVNLILEDLEKRRFFLFRNEAGEVAWAYPVTADSTPHQVSFSTGEQIYAA